MSSVTLSVAGAANEFENYILGRELTESILATFDVNLTSLLAIINCSACSLSSNFHYISPLSVSEQSKRSSDS